ncbi:MAG: hypothetical protein LBD40_04090 [Puniceicoccales bacterium]|nr:hypothetical protein [Puniceicoccales bacterium]
MTEVNVKSAVGEGCCVMFEGCFGMSGVFYRLCAKEKMKAFALHFSPYRSPRSRPEPEGLKGGKRENFGVDGG